MVFKHRVVPITYTWQLLFPGPAGGGGGGVGGMKVTGLTRKYDARRRNPSAAEQPTTWRR